MLGETRTYSFERITPAIRLIGGGRALHRDEPGRDRARRPTGPLPATGSVAALISRATGVEPYYVGKPNPLMMRSALNAIDAHSETTAMIGDRMDTDVVAGLEAGPAHDPRAHRRRRRARRPSASRTGRRGSSTRSPTSSTRWDSRRVGLTPQAAARRRGRRGGGGGDRRVRRRHGQRRNDGGHDQCADRGPGGPVDVGGRPPRTAARPAHARVLRLPARPPPAPGPGGDRAPPPRCSTPTPRATCARPSSRADPAARGRALPRRRAATTSR